MWIINQNSDWSGMETGSEKWIKSIKNGRISIFWHDPNPPLEAAEISQHLFYNSNIDFTAPAFPTICFTAPAFIFTTPTFIFTTPTLFLQLQHLFYNSRIFHYLFYSSIWELSLAESELPCPECPWVLRQIFWLPGIHRVFQDVSICVRFFGKIFPFFGEFMVCVCARLFEKTFPFFMILWIIFVQSEGGLGWNGL